MIAAFNNHRWGCLNALVALAVAAVVWAGHGSAAEALREHPYFAINQLTISGCGPALTAEDLRDWLGFTGESSLWDASPARVRARLEAHPFIAHAAVRREFPDRLDIVVRERRPQAIAVLDDLYYVDRRGVTFGPLRAQDSRDYPLVTGIGPGAAAGPGQWALRRALRLLRRGDRDPCIGVLSEVHLEDGGGVVVYLAAPRLPIVLGWGSWPTKLERAERALRAWGGGAERLTGLDLRYRNQVVVGLRPPPAPAPPRQRGSGAPSGRSAVGMLRPIHGEHGRAPAAQPVPSAPGGPAAGRRIEA